MTTMTHFKTKIRIKNFCSSLHSILTFNFDDQSIYFTNSYETNNTVFLRINANLLCCTFVKRKQNIRFWHLFNFFWIINLNNYDTFFIVQELFSPTNILLNCWHHIQIVFLWKWPSIFAMLTVRLFVRIIIFFNNKICSQYDEYMLS